LGIGLYMKESIAVLTDLYAFCIRDDRIQIISQNDSIEISISGFTGNSKSDLFQIILKEAT
jgi:hypothetical protein